MSRPSLRIILLLVVSLSASSHRSWRSERAIEGLYLNKTDGCDAYVSRHQRSFCKHVYNLTTVLRTATNQAVQLCKFVFQYEHWNCRIDKTIFTKVGRERAILTSLLAWSVSQTAARFCAKGELAGCYFWPELECLDVTHYGAEITKNYFLSGGIGFDIIGRMVKHNIEHGIQRSRETQCICFKPFNEWRLTVCVPPVLSNKELADTFISIYHSAYKWQSNSPQFKELRRRKNQIVYIEDSEDYCGQTKNRICTDPDSCSYLCCGRGFIKRKIYLEKIFDCTCKFRPFIICNQCVSYKIINFCR